MKKILAFILIFIFLASNSIVANAQTSIGTNLSIISPNSIDIRNTAIVDIYLNTNSKVAGIQFNITCNNGKFINIASGLSNTYFNYQLSDNAINNVIIVTTGAGSYITGNVKIASISLYATQVGVINLSFSNVIIGDTNAIPINCAFNNKSINVIDTTNQLNIVKDKKETKWFLYELKPDGTFSKFSQFDSRGKAESEYKNRLIWGNNLILIQGEIIAQRGY